MDIFEKEKTIKIVTTKIKEIRKEIANNTIQINNLKTENNVLVYQLKGLMKAFEELTGVEFDIM